MLLSYVQLWDLIRAGIIRNVRPGAVNGTTIDLTLGNTILVEQYRGIRVVDLSGATSLAVEEVDITDGYVLRPGQFVLAHTVEEFNLPLDISAEYMLNSSIGRIGLEHLKAGWCDPGWHSSVLTLELKNLTSYHSIRIKAGDRIGQVKFYAHDAVPETVSYRKRGRYNGDSSVSGTKEPV